MFFINHFNVWLNKRQLGFCIFLLLICCNTILIEVYEENPDSYICSLKGRIILRIFSDNSDNLF